MPCLKVGAREIELNEDGFLAHPEDWDENVASAFAVEDHIPSLTSDHWKVIYYLRDYYRRFRIAPMIRKLCKETGFSKGEIDSLFPSGPARGACRISGLPKTTGCL